LGSWPALHGDEAIQGVIAERVIDGGLSRLTAARVYSSPVIPLMHIPLVAALGRTAFALRLLALLSGLISIVALYGAARRLLGQRAAYVAAAATAILPLGVILGRLGWDVAMAPPTTALAMYLGVLAWQERRVDAAVGAGLCLALGTYVYSAAALAPVAMAVGVGVSGRLRRHLREACIVLVIVVGLSFPTVRLVSDWFSHSGTGLVAAWRYGATMGSTGEWASPLSARLAALNIVHVLDHWTGATTLEFLLGKPDERYASLVKAVRYVCLAAWLVLLFVASRAGAKGRFLLGYLAAVFLLGHFANPAFVNVPAKGRYLIATLPVLALLLGLAANSCGRGGTAAKAGATVLLASWAGMAVLMLSFIGRNMVGNIEMTTTAGGDPNALAAEYLLQRVNPKDELVLCSSWWTYWPIAYYSSERLPMFTSDLVHAENEQVILPRDRRKVWWVQLPFHNAPPFPAECVMEWPEVGGQARGLSIWIARDPAAAIRLTVEDYQARKAEKLRALSEPPYRNVVPV